MTIRPDTDEIIEFLNSLVEVDPFAVAELLCIRVPCNDALAAHPTVQVEPAGRTTFIPPGTFRLTVLGLLNGFCGIIDEEGPHKNWGPIAAQYDGHRLIGFVRTETLTP